MRLFRALLVLLGRGGGMRRLEQEIDDELRFHLEMKAAALKSGGMAPEAAGLEARQRLGDVARIRRDGAWILAGAAPSPGRVFDGLLLDIRHGVRQLARRPAFTLLAAGILALGLSASTAVFTYIEAYRRPIPGADADGVVQVYGSLPGAPFTPISWPDYQDLAAAGGAAFDAAAEQSGFAASVRYGGRVDVAFGQGVTGNLFAMLGIPLRLGRGIAETDDTPDAEPVVVLSHAWWLTRFGGDPAVIGGTVFLNNEPYTVIGVAAPEFRGTRAALRPDLWLPFEQYKRVYWARSDAATNREAMVVSPYLRVERRDRERARQAVSALAASLDREHPLEAGARRFLLEPARWIHPAARLAEISSARIMLAAAAGLLLLACANVANLVLTLGLRRRQELAMRSAIGATPQRLVRQLLAESLLLALLAGVVALALAVPAANRIGSFFARPSVWGANVPREVSLDATVFLFGLAVVMATGLAAGVLPAWRASRRNVLQGLRASGTGTVLAATLRSRAGSRTGGLLVSLQLALAVVLLVIAALVLRTLDAVQRIDPGFDVRTTVASFVSTSSIGTPPAERPRFYRQLLARYEALPWVRAATLADAAPLSPHGGGPLRLDGLEQPVTVRQAKVVPGYFETLGVPLLRGRTLSAGDTAGARDVVLVNETLASRYFENGDPLGRRLWLGGGPGEAERAFEIVGVTGNAKLTDLLAEAEPVVYFSYPQHYYTPGNALLLSTTIEPAAALPLLEQELRAVDNRMALVNALPYSEVVRGFTWAQRMNAELFSVVALFGLILAAAGLFAVMSLAVAQRRREIGIRLAIGAPRREIARLVLGGAARTIGLGLAAGFAGALAATRLVRSLLLGVEPSDPISLSCGIAVLVGAALLAAWLPARQAMRVDPLTTLRVE